MSSGLRLSRTGKEAQCFAISSSLSARRRLLRRLFICSRRSFNAFVTASVFVSPVRAARSEANFSVSWFRMFNASVSLQVENFIHRYILARRATFLRKLSAFSTLETPQDQTGQQYKKKREFEQKVAKETKGRTLGRVMFGLSSLAEQRLK